MPTDLPTPKMTPEVWQRFEQLKADHSACVRGELADGRSVADAHAICSHIEREMTALATTSTDIIPDPEG